MVPLRVLGVLCSSWLFGFIWIWPVHCLICRHNVILAFSTKDLLLYIQATPIMNGEHCTDNFGSKWSLVNDCEPLEFIWSIWFYVMPSLTLQRKMYRGHWRKKRMSLPGIILLQIVVRSTSLPWHNQRWIFYSVAISFRRLRIFRPLLSPGRPTSSLPIPRRRST